MAEVGFVCSIKAEPTMPVRNVELGRVRVAHVLGRPITTQNVIGFASRPA